MTSDYCGFNRNSVEIKETQALKLKVKYRTRKEMRWRKRWRTGDRDKEKQTSPIYPGGHRQKGS